MGWKTSLTPSRMGALLVVALLALLYFLEPLVKSPRFVFKPPTSEPSQYPVFTTEDSFVVVSSGPWSFLKASQKIRLKDLLEAPETAGRPVLINFWATWCEPCIEEIPTLNVLTRQLASLNDAKLPLVITISVDETPAAILKLRKTLGMDLEFPVLLDSDGQYARKFGITRFPETFLIQKEGRVLRKWIGPQDWLSQETLQYFKTCAEG